MSSPPDGRRAERQRLARHLKTFCADDRVRTAQLIADLGGTPDEVAAVLAWHDADMRVACLSALINFAIWRGELYTQ